MRRKLFISAFIALIATALLHIIAVRFLLYWSVWWFDIVVHFCGGYFVSGFLFWFLFQWTIVRKNLYVIFSAFVLTLCVTIMWEIFELYAGISGFGNGYFLDSGLDMIMGMTGGVSAYFYAVRLGKADKKLVK